MTRVTEMEDVLKSVGAPNKFPLYLLPQISKSFQDIGLDTELKMKEGGVLEREAEAYWEILPDGHKDTTFTISGEIPDYAMAGDTIVVKVSVQYPEAINSKARTVAFYEYIHVGEPEK
jgi:hypothetical protein